MLDPKEMPKAKEHFWAATKDFDSMARLVAPKSQCDRFESRQAIYSNTNLQIFFLRAKKEELFVLIIV